MKKELQYLKWSPPKTIDDIFSELEPILQDGWDIVSHCQNQYGMSVILVREAESE